MCLLLNIFYIHFHQWYFVLKYLISLIKMVEREPRKIQGNFTLSWKWNWKVRSFVTGKKDSDFCPFPVMKQSVHSGEVRSAFLSISFRESKNHISVHFQWGNNLISVKSILTRRDSRFFQFLFGKVRLTFMSISFWVRQCRISDKSYMLGLL